MNILVIGLGSIGLKHVNAIKALPGNHSISALRSSRICSTVDGVQNIYSHDEMPLTPDFVIISNPTSLHKETIEQCIHFSRPLFIEKPAFHSLDEVDAILPALDRIPTYIACNLRFHPAIMFLRNYLSDHPARINEVNIYCGSYLPDWRKGKDFRTSYSADPSMGGGVHLDLIHEVDYCCWLFGYPIGSDMLRRNSSSLGIEAIDYANCRMIYRGFVTNVILNYYRRDTKRAIEIVFEDDTWSVDLVSCIIKNNAAEVVFSAQYDVLKTYTEQMKYFITTISAGQRPMNNIREAVETLKIVLS